MYQGTVVPVAEMNINCKTEKIAVNNFVKTTSSFGWVRCYANSIVDVAYVGISLFKLDSASFNGNFSFIHQECNT